MELEVKRIKPEKKRVKNLIETQGSVRLLSAQHLARMSKKDISALKETLQEHGEDFDKYVEEVNKAGPPIVVKKPLVWRVR